MEQWNIEMGRTGRQHRKQFAMVFTSTPILHDSNTPGYHARLS
jgi:hypothetical protein